MYLPISSMKTNQLARFGPWKSAKVAQRMSADIICR